jgi:hypothetical protein
MGAYRTSEGLHPRPLASSAEFVDSSSDSGNRIPEFGLSGHASGVPSEGDRRSAAEVVGHVGVRGGGAAAATAVLVFVVACAAGAEVHIPADGEEPVGDAVNGVLLVRAEVERHSRPFSSCTVLPVSC